MRKVLYLTSQNGADPVCAALTEAGWEVHPAGDLVRAGQLMDELDFAVGILRIAGEAELQQLEPFVACHPAVDWVALLDRALLQQEEVRLLIVEACFDYHTLPCDPVRLAVTLGRAYGMAHLRKRQESLPENAGEPTMIGNSSVMRQLVRTVRKVARVDAPVLISGESGTGKELAAASIHRLSARAAGPMVAVDCGALPANLIQSELFGYEKGAFTGAYQSHKGLIESAAGGTVFLDEVGDLPREMQVNLLRFLQEKTISRLGSAQKIPVDVRVIAATHVDLESAVHEGRFREDLYYRLKVLHFSVPPLRERRSDIGMLADFYFAKFSRERKFKARGYSAAALQAMRDYSWPGNVRELVNRIRQALVMCETAFIRPEDLGLQSGSERKALQLDDARAVAEKKAIESCLHNVGHNISRASRDLGVSRVTLYRLMDKYAIPTRPRPYNGVRASAGELPSDAGARGKHST